MRFIVSKQKDMVVTINSVDDQTKYNVETFVISNMSGDTILVATDSLDEVITFVREYDLHVETDNLEEKEVEGYND
tara:strand:+ start:1643 stop:1870 length:228 start_codon:yes stop_codon:yes gene_type:complete